MTAPMGDIASAAGELEGEGLMPKFWFRQHFYGIPISIFRCRTLPRWEWTEERDEWTIYIDPSGLGLVHPGLGGASVFVDGPQWYEFSKNGIIAACLAFIPQDPYLAPLMSISRIAG